MNDLLQAALRYAKLGWHVFPIAPGQKIPLTKHGVKDATTNEETIVNWWTASPTANIAVACGPASGVHVCDIDVGEKVSGWESLAKAGIYLPDTVMQNTPGGGSHLFYRTDDPPANKNSFLPGIDIRSTGYYVVLAPSIHPNGGEYQWAQDSAPWEHHAAVWPSELRPTVQPPKPPRAAPAPVTLQDHGQDDVLRRASAYLALCDPAVQGLGGHDKLLWAAVCMVHGFLLTDGQALDILTREYNPRCDPPWDLSLQSDEKDFRRKVGEARKLAPKRHSGWLLHDDEYAMPAAISQAQAALFIKNSMGHQLLLEEYQPEEEDEDLELMREDPEWKFLTQPTGLLGAICSWINKTAIREQPLLALGTALTFCGTLFGRKIKDGWGLRTNLYCMGLGESSSGKNHAPKQIRQLCHSACCLDLIGGDDFASDSAIECRLEKHPATLFLLDEVGHLLSHAKSSGNAHLAKIVPLLMKLYSTAGDVYLGKEYAEEGKQREIVQPCCSVWGNTTPNEFISGLSSRDLKSGWLSRCLVFRTDDKPAKNRTLIDQDVPGELADKVAEWFFRKVEPAGEVSLGSLVKQRFGNNSPALPEQILVPVTTAANEIFQKFDDDSEKEALKFPETSCLWSKAEENARKIALIVAASERFDSPEITPAIADYSCRLIHFLLSSFCIESANLIADNVLDGKKKQILSVVRKAGIKGLLRRQITQKTQRIFNQNERNACLADLIEAGELYVKQDGHLVTFRTERNHMKHLAKEEKKNAT